MGMTTINSDQFFNELAYCLEQKDVVKARALFQFVMNSDADIEMQKKVLTKLANGHDSVVFPLFEYLVKADIPNAQFKDALFLLILDKAYSNKPLTVKFITQADKAVRLWFIKAVGELFLTDLAPDLQKIVTEEDDKDMVIEAINALGKLRTLEALPVMAGMAGIPDRDIKKAAVFALSRSGLSDAVDQLLGFLGEDGPTNAAAIEALANIQDLYAIDMLVHFLSATDTLLRDTSIDQLIKLGPKSVPVLIKSLQNADEDTLVHIITTLGYIADPAAAISILDIIQDRPKNPNVRQAAYEALERIHSPETLYAIVQGLKDPVESVRMSAARAAVKNFSITMVAWLRNEIRKNDATAQFIVSALIDSDADNIFEYLVTEDEFFTIAEDHVNSKADPETRKTFLKCMERIGQNDFVSRVSLYSPAIAAVEKKESRIVVIDDSKMILKLLTNKLAAIGLTPITFNRPQEALPEILGEKPDLIITDLNMPDINGLDLSRVIRKQYTKEDVPILMITTQGNFPVAGRGAPGQADIGINHVLYKPFSDDQFQTAVTTLLGSD